jgi:hypothetical protein
MKLTELMAGITPGKRYVGAPIRSGDTLGVNVQHNEDGGESYEETIAEVLPSTKEGQQKADAAYLAHCANHLPKLVEAFREIMEINNESPSACRKRMGTRRGNSIAVASRALAAAQEVEGV